MRECFVGVSLVVYAVNFLQAAVALFTKLGCCGSVSWNRAVAR